MTRHVILYVDDEAPNRIVFEQSFKTRFAVRTAASGAQALQIIAAEPIAVVVTDQRMAGMTGSELLERVKQQRPAIVRVVVSAYSDPSIILDHLNRDLAARYVLKPWSRAELHETLVWALETYDARIQHAASNVRRLQATNRATHDLAIALADDLGLPSRYLANASAQLGELAALSDDEASVPALARLATGIADAAAAIEELAKRLRAIADDRPGGDTCGSPRAVIDELFTVARPLAADANASLTYVGPELLPPVRFTAPKLGQVLLNLVVNASEALMRRAEPDARITLGAAELGDFVELWVQDNGPGVDPAVIERLHSPLPSHGEGLGLMQCRRLLAPYNGVLQLQSQPGCGARASIVLEKVG
jgi:C4-dicarboxylate-specific signal transduction histidine kinase